MRILITGGCGFIGSHLADALVTYGDKVIILDNLSTGKQAQAPPAAELVIGDIADTALVARLVSGADAVFHLAAVASVEACARDRPGSYRTNVTGSIAVLNAAAMQKIPVIYASSAAVYGDNPNIPLTEDATPQPISAYGEDKLALERYAAAMAESHRLRSVGLRFFNVYGPRQDPRSPYSGVISKFMDCARHETPLTLFGDGGQTRDFIAVSDIIHLMRSALEYVGKHEGAEIFNGCTGVRVNIAQLAAAIIDVCGKPLAIHRAPPRAGDIRDSLGSPVKASEILGFRATASIAQGLRQLAGTADA